MTSRPKVAANLLPALPLTFIQQQHCMHNMLTIMCQSAKGWPAKKEKNGIYKKIHLYKKWVTQFPQKDLVRKMFILTLVPT
jgi:hypothetical protein